MSTSKALKEEKEERYLKSEPKFSQWLYYQRDREDSVGGLARFADNDHKEGEYCWPQIANTIASFTAHVRTKHARTINAPSEITIRDAFSEFRRFLDTGGKIPARVGGVKKSRSPNTHRGYVVPPSTVAHIKAIAEHMQETQGETLERIVASEYMRLFP